MSTPWGISVDNLPDRDGGGLTVAQARALATALQNAADDLEKAIDGNPWPVDSATRSCCNVIGGHGPECTGGAL